MTTIVFIFLSYEHIRKQLRTNAHSDDQDMTLIQAGIVVKAVLMSSICFKIAAEQRVIISATSLQKSER